MNKFAIISLLFLSLFCLSVIAEDYNFPVTCSSLSSGFCKSATFQTLTVINTTVVNQNTTGLVNAYGYNINGTSTDNIYMKLSQSNWYTPDGWLYYNATTKQLLFNQTKISGQEWYFVINYTQYGTAQGNINLTWREDDISLNITESVPNALVYYANTTANITSDVNQICIRYKYSSNDILSLSLIKTTGNYENYISMGELAEFSTQCESIPDIAEHIINGKLVMRISHSGVANSQHKLSIDKLWVKSGLTSTVTNEIDPYAMHIVGDVTDITGTKSGNFSINIGNGSIRANEMNWNGSDLTLGTDFNRLVVGTDMGSSYLASVQTQQITTDVQTGALAFRARVNPSANTNNPRFGIIGWLQTFGSKNYTATLYGMFGQFEAVGTGIIDEALGVAGDVLGYPTISQTINDGKAFRARIIPKSADIINGYGFYASSASAPTTNGSLNNMYSFYDQGQTNAVVNWGYYGLSAQNAMSGSLSLGKLTNATATLDVNGTITSNNLWTNNITNYWNTSTGIGLPLKIIAGQANNTAQAGGTLYLLGGPYGAAGSGGAPNGRGGNVDIKGGVGGPGGGVGGDVNISGGDATTGGNVIISTGIGASSSGHLKFLTGASSGAAGSINFTTSAASGAGGPISFQSGDGNSVGGTISFLSGSSSSSSGGSISFTAGNGTIVGGDISFTTREGGIGGGGNIGFTTKTGYTYFKSNVSINSNQRPSATLDVNGSVLLKQTITVLGNATGGVSGWFSGNVSASGYITRTSTFDNKWLEDKNKENRSLKALDFIKNGSQYLTSDLKINHSAFEYSKITYETRDYDRSEYEIITYQNENNETITLNNTYFPYIRNESGIDIGREMDLMRQAIFELKTELCLAKPNTYSWC